MLSVVKIVNATRFWYESGAVVKARVAADLAKGGAADLAKGGAHG
jgi:hypothetical protein